MGFNVGNSSYLNGIFFYYFKSWEIDWGEFLPGQVSPLRFQAPGMHGWPLDSLGAASGGWDGTSEPME